MTRHTYDPTYHLLVAEQHHLRPVDEATRTTPAFSREEMGFKMPESRVVKPASSRWR